MQYPARSPILGGMFLSDQQENDIYATSGMFFNIISQTLMQLPNVHMFVFNESARHRSFPMCANPLGAHFCETPFVLSEVNLYNVTNGIDNLQGGDSMDTVVQQNMRRV